MEWYGTLRGRTNSKMLHLLFLMFLAYPGSGMPDEMQENKYIVGGKNTDIKEVPYQAALFYGKEFMCGAIIVSRRYLLTAAHCIPGHDREYRIRVGSSFKDKGGVVHKVKKAVKHPSYTHKKYNYDYDIAFLEVTKPIKFNEKVQHICVTDWEPKSGDKAKISGYGKQPTGNFPKQLQSAEVVILDRARCTAALNGTVSRRMICSISKHMNTCPFKGDSGGPLVVNEKVVGAVSWFDKNYDLCKKPFVYTNLADKEIRKFIREHTGV